MRESVSAHRAATGLRRVMLLAVAVAVVLPVGAPVAGAPGARDALGAQVAAAAPRRPVRQGIDFIENRGQWAAETRFVAWRGNLTAAFANDGIRLAQSDGSPLTLRFDGAAEHVRLEGERPRGSRYNFIYGDDPSGWRTGVRAYSSLRYRGVHPGVDVRVREGRAAKGSGTVEYDVLVAPRADARQLTIRADGASRLSIAHDGALLIHTPVATLRQPPPVSWEVLPKGEKRPLASRFRLLGGTRYGFDVTGRDPNARLVIDPGLEWATFLGGSGDESVTGLELTRDGSGDIVVAGQTQSPDFPHTRGQMTPVGWTPYVARLNATGTALVYATFFGGSGNHSVQDVALDAADRPVVVGDTTSEDFPTTPGAYDRTPGNGFQGDYDAYVIQFDALGGGPVFGTYLGGAPSAGLDQAWRAAFDPAGNVVVAGVTTSPTYPTTPGAYDRSIGGRDVFVSRLDPTGSHLTYSTFLGGDGVDEVYDMAIDPGGVVSLTGKISQFPDQPQHFPTTVGAYDTTFDGGGSVPAIDAYLARLRLDGAGSADLRYATFLGGAQYKDGGTGVAFDPADPTSVTVVGWTYSGDFPTTPGALLRTHFLPVDASMAFLMRFRFTTAGSSLVWSTLYGAPGSQHANDVAIDGTGAPIIVGATGADNPPTTERAWDRVPGTGANRGTADGYVARIAADGGRVLYSTLLGGSNNDDAAQHVVWAGERNAIVAGLTDSPDFPVTPGAFDTVYGADGQPSGSSAPGSTANDVFVARVALAPADGDVAPPPAPALRGPAVGATYIAHVLGVTFDWTDVSDASGISAYHIQVSPNAAFRDDVEARLTGWYEAWVPTSVDVTGFSISETGTFSWRVRALDGNTNLGPWSEVRTFTVQDPTPPAAPVLVSPPNDGLFAPGTIVLDWNPAARAKFYDLEVDTRSDFANPGRVRLRGLTATRHAISLTTEGRRWWRVRGTNDSLSAGPWSTVRTFVLRSGAPAAPVPPPEADGGSPTGTGAQATGISRLTPEELALQGGRSAQLTVHLNAVAPAGGAVVRLASRYPSLATVPPSVTIPAGASSASFAVTAAAGLFRGGYTVVSAAYGSGPDQGVLVNVWPDQFSPELYSMSIRGTTVSSGTTTQGTVSVIGGETLSGSVGFTPGWTAGAGGAVVALGSTRPGLASVPDRVVVAQGQNGVSFTVTTRPVDRVTRVTILAARSITHRIVLELLPPGALQSLSLDPATVVGGNPSTGTVRLASPAPAGGTTVALSSSDTRWATVPASVTVPAGASSATFTVATNQVTTGQGESSFIAASSGGLTRTATINVNPAPPGGGLSSLTLNPTTVTGGSSSTGRVTLVSAASQNVFVTLSSSNTAAATVPVSVTIPAGSTSASFTVSTTAASTNRSSTITASAGGTSRSATLTVTATSSTTDTVSITRAEYDSGQRLRVEATSTSSTATLRAYVTSTNALIGTLRNDGSGRYSADLAWSTNPQSITVRSSLGGAATRTVTLK